MRAYRGVSPCLRKLSKALVLVNAEPLQLWGLGRRKKQKGCLLKNPITHHRQSYSCLAPDSQSVCIYR